MSEIITYFKSPAALRRWLTAHGATEKELWIGFYNKDSGRGGITYKEALDEALCFGWIDGIRKKVDAGSCTNRFSPRRRRSRWSMINIRRAKALTVEGRMTPAGAAAFEARDEKASRALHEQRYHPAFGAAEQRAFRADKAAWTFFQAQSPSYRRLSTFYVMGAKRPETREKRVRLLMDLSRRGKKLGM